MEIVNYLGNRMGSGGIESFINNVASDMVDYGYNYTVCANYPGESIYADQLRNVGANVEFILDKRTNYLNKMLAYAFYMRKKVTA